MGEPTQVRRKRFDVTIVYLDDGKGDDYESAMVNSVIHDGMALIDIEEVEDVDLVPRSES